MKDLLNNIDLETVISPSAGPSDDTAQVSSIVDCQGLASLTFVIATGTLADADATFTVLVEEGDDSGLSDAAAVADDELIGASDSATAEANAGFTFENDDAARKIGYRGTKRYARITITPANNTGAAPMCVVAVKEPMIRPAANQPA